MTKEKIRQQFKQKRKELSASQKMKSDDLILIQLQRLVLPDDCEILLTYWPIEHHNEPDTHIYTRYFQLIIPTLQVAFPKIDQSSHTMKAIITHENTSFTSNQYGIAEPEHSAEEIISPDSIDIIFVPLLAFDCKGYRVGYGKGYYDRFLINCKPNVLKIGFSYFEPLTVIEDTNQYDVPLDYCITPDRIYEF